MSPDQIPDTHFIDSNGRPHPLVVRHDTGEAEYAIVNKACVPFAEYRAPAAAASEPTGFRVQSPEFSGYILVN